LRAAGQLLVQQLLALLRDSARAHHAWLVHQPCAEI
jgi:hypothetical protein